MQALGLGQEQYCRLIRNSAQRCNNNSMLARSMAPLPEYHQILVSAKIPSLLQATTEALSQVRHNFLRNTAAPPPPPHIRLDVSVHHPAPQCRLGFNVSGSSRILAHVAPLCSREALNEQPAFDEKLYMQRLRSTCLGHVLLSAALLPSTQTLLHENSAVLPCNLVCVADRQASGKGAFQPIPKVPNNEHRALI